MKRELMALAGCHHESLDHRERSEQLASRRPLTTALQGRLIEPRTGPECLTISADVHVGSLSESVGE